MNAEDFINYAALAIILFAGCGLILWDAWRDRRDATRDEERCCAPGYGCDKCYYGLGK